MSDDLSADSYFAGESFLSKHWSKKSGWDLGLRGSERSSGRTKGSSGYAPSIEEVEEDEEEKKEEEPAQDDAKDNTKDSWDLRWVESSFPVKESSAGDMFDFDSGATFSPDPCVECRRCGSDAILGEFEVGIWCQYIYDVEVDYANSEKHVSTIYPTGQVAFRHVGKRTSFSISEDFLSPS
jgi:hypothetical protein